MSSSLQGRLLVATPELADPNFALTVVLIIDHTDEGAVGVVLNRPSDLEVEEAVPEWAGLAADPPVVFVGGPVRPNALIGVARADTPPPDGWEEVLPGLGVINLGDHEPDRVEGALRVFAGYAGWGGEQLEGEIAEGAWFVVDAEVDDVFATDLANLWTVVLRRQGGIFTTVTTEPSLN